MLCTMEKAKFYSYPLINPKLIETKSGEMFDDDTWCVYSLSETWAFNLTAQASIVRAFYSKCAALPV